jgi:hypothetical protein
MKKLLIVLASLLFSVAAYAQNLPAGSVGIVTNNTPNTWQSFNYTFSPSQSGANFIGFAFRQDPAYWTFDNVRLTAAGSQTNLLTNGAFDHGGQFNITTSNGPGTIQAPTNWGVWYQNGTYPAAAGTWQDIGGSNGGVWYDGAVGSFDGIYQGVNLTAGVRYTITFDVSGNHTSDGGAVQLGVYGGACATVSIAPDQCTIPSSVGFTTLATPAQGASAGGPPTPTVVSTAPGTPRVTSTVANGTATSTSVSTRGTTSNVANAVLGTTVTTSSNRDVAARNVQTIDVTRTTTVVNATPRTTTTTATTPITTVTTTVTPRTTTTTTIPVTITTYSDGTTTSADGTPAVTTSTTNVSSSTTTTTNEVIVSVVRDSVVQTTASDRSASVSAVALKDAIAISKFNPFLVDVLSTKDGAWATPQAGYAKTTGSFRTSSIGFGAQKTVYENTLGIAGTYGKSNSHSFLNSASDSDSYGATVYALNKQNAVWTKLAIGFGVSEYSTTTALPIFALANSSKVKVNNYYADLTFYSGREVYGFRPLVGVVITDSKVSSATETGSPLLSTLPEKKSNFEARPYAGVRYDFNDNIGVETRVTQSKDFKTVGQVRLTAKKEIFKNVYFDVQGGFDKSSNYTAAVGMVGLKVNF